MKYTQEDVDAVIVGKEAHPGYSSKELSKLLELPDYFIRRTCNKRGLYFGHYTPFKSKKSLFISKEAENIITGSLLGDGYISKYKLDNSKVTNKNSKFEIKHGNVQKEYAIFKSELLQEYGLNNSISYIDKKDPHRYDGNLIVNNGSIVISSSQNKVFNSYRDLWYSNSIKIIPINIKISPLSLAIWAMDDGANSKSGGFYFHSQGFTLKENDQLRYILKNTFNIDSVIHYSRGKPIIYVKRNSKKLLFDIIDEFICNNMRYKFVF